MYTWDPYSGSVEAIGDSTDFKNQYGHTSVIPSELDKIVLFGGYGYWQYKNALTFFDFKTNQWSSISSNSPDSTFPSPRTDAMMTINPQNNQVHLTGGFSTPSGRDDIQEEITSYINDYWILDLERNSWTRYPVLKDVRFLDIRVIRPNPPFIQTNWGTYDSKHNQALFVHRIDDQNGKYGLLVFNEKIQQAVPLSLGLESGFKNAALLGYDYLEKSHQIIAFWMPLKSIGERSDIVVKLYSLPAQEHIIAEIETMVAQGKRAKVIQSQINILLYATLGCSLLLISFILFKNLSKRYFNKNSSSTVLELHYLKEPQIFYNNKNISSNLAHSTMYLCLWMYWKYLSGTEYVITDEIESRFVDESTNVDYSRKKRNAVIKRFQDDFNSIISNQDVSLHIMDRVHPDDKRKREFFIHTQGVEIISDIDSCFNADNSYTKTEPTEHVDSALLLKNINDAWANDIRRSVQSRSKEVI
jgi:hypothetical protein